MKSFKIDECREVLDSGNVVNCVKKPVVMRAKQMTEDFTVETLEHQKEPYQGKAGDYIMISPSCEMYVCDKDFFEKNYEVQGVWSLKQHATSMEDYAYNMATWNDTPFNDDALKILRLKKIANSPSYQKSINRTGR